MPMLLARHEHGTRFQFLTMPPRHANCQRANGPPNPVQQSWVSTQPTLLCENNGQVQISARTGIWIVELFGEIKLGI